MQKEILEMFPESSIRILGVNEVGQEYGNAAVCVGREIPWLQEVSASPIWGPWEVAYRDVVILDEQNEVAGVFNLTTYNLDYPGNYAGLRNLLIEIADERPPK